MQTARDLLTDKTEDDINAEYHESHHEQTIGQIDVIESSAQGVDDCVLAQVEVTDEHLNDSSTGVRNVVSVAADDSRQDLRMSEGHDEGSAGINACEIGAVGNEFSCREGFG